MAQKIVELGQWTPGLKGYYSIAVGDQLFEMQSAEKSYSLTSPEAGVARFELRDGDQHSWDALVGSKSERVEIADRNTLAHGTPLHVSYDFMLEPGSPNTAEWMVIGQLHQDLFDGAKRQSPPFEVAMRGEKMIIDIRYTGPDGNAVTKQIFTDVKDIDRGHHYDIDIRAVFDPNGGGRLVVVRDGVTIADYSGPLGYADHKGVYWAEGIYRDGAATETVAAQFSNLKIESGPSVTIPNSSEFIWAPEMKVSSVGAVDGNANRTVEVSGTAKIGTVVSIYEKDVLLGKAAVDANGNYSLKVLVHSSGEHLLNAVATDAGGRNGILSNPMTVEVGTAAEIVARLSTLAKAGNVGTIVLTDTQNLTVTKTQLSEFLSYGSLVSKIQGDVTFSTDTKITGQSTYDKQTEIYSETGVVLERLRYSGSKLVFDEKIAPNGESLTRIFYNDGTSALNYSINGKLLSSTQFNTAGVATFKSITNIDGSKELDYFDGTTGAMTRIVSYTADGARTEKNFGITGKDFTTQIYTFDKTGKQLSQERTNDAGATVFLRKWLPNGDVETHNYNAAGKETSLGIAYADGSRAEGNFTITGQSFSGQILYYSKTNALTMRERFDADGHIKTQEVFGANASVKTYAYDAKGALTGWTTVAADNSSVAVTLYPGSTTKVAKSVAYDAKGLVLKTEYFDTNGKSLGSSGTAPTTPAGQNSTEQSYSYDTATGLKTGVTVKASDGTYTVSKFAGGNETAVTSIEKFAANGTLKLAEAYDGKGLLTARKSFLDNGSVQTDNFGANGAKVQTVIVSTDGSSKATTFDKLTGAVTSLVLTDAANNRAVTDYGLTGKAYTEQVAKYDAANNVTALTRSYADGKIAFDQKVNADGSQIIKEWSKSGLPTVETKIDAKGNVVATTRYDNNGQKVQMQETDANGARTTHSYDAATGKETSASTVYLDKSRSVENYDIKDKLYSKQVAVYDAAGKLLDLSRFYSDGTLAFDQKYNGDGSSHVENYDTAGRMISKIQALADGSKDVFAFTYATSADAGAMRTMAATSSTNPGATVSQQEHFSAAKVREWSDVTSADGSHVKTAYVAGVTLGSSTQDDTLVGIRGGGDTFKFSDKIGHDTVKNFNTGTAGGLDILALNDLLAQNFGQVKDKMTTQGADTLITFDAHNTVLLKDVAASQLTENNFKFIPHDILVA